MIMRVAKRQIHRSLAAAGYRLVKDNPEPVQAAPVLVPDYAPAPAPSVSPDPPLPTTSEPPYLVALKQAAGGRPIPPKMLDTSYPGVEDLGTFLRRYGIDSVLERRFYNIGAAWNRHAGWTMVDHPSAWYAGDQKDNLDLKWDISTLAPIDVESSTAEAVYSSHTVEHLLDPHVEHMFREAYRILKPGGWFRVTCPDIMLFYEAYRRGEDEIMLYGSLRGDFSRQQIFLNEFASQITDIMKRGTPQGAAPITITDDDVDRIFSTLPFDQACNHFTAMIDYELQKVTPGAHINWWTHEKVEQFMRRAGFTKIRRSGHKQSTCAAMRGKEFDTTHIAYSLYVEAER
jgi:ubiquinone/menaquinone biosynthesis C-methylase UbiE